uniref:Uncharacterized protein n=1 Tax=Tetradesmus obliquus TaxID=3088 RepID=A0A383WII4_TETOB|eukprot:jgi/Sobl393_1/8322/SZX76959.1
MQATAGGGRQDEQAAAWLVFCANVDEWRRVVPGLVVAKGGKATFEGTPLVTSQGLVTLPPEIPDGSEIH